MCGEKWKLVPNHAINFDLNKTSITYVAVVCAVEAETNWESAAA